MYSPITHLPPELFIATFSCLPKEERTLCTMTLKIWRDLIKRYIPTPKTNPNTLLEHAAIHGCRSQLKLAKAGGATNFMRTIVLAAQKGHPELMKLLRAWGISRFVQQITAAAYRTNFTECIELLKQLEYISFAIATRVVNTAYTRYCKFDSNREYLSPLQDVAAKRAKCENLLKCIKLAQKWGAIFNKKKINNAFICAVERGNINCLKLIKDLFITNLSQTDVKEFKGLCMPAVLNGGAECLKLLKGWGITHDDPDELLAYSAQLGHIECLKLVKDWGATNFNWALRNASMECQIKTMKLLKEWGANDFNEALTALMTGNKNFVRNETTQDIINGMKLLKSWGATDFDKALAEAAMEGEVECLKLLKEWGATKFKEAIITVSRNMAIDIDRCIKHDRDYLATHLTCHKVQTQIKCTKLLKKWEASAKERKPSN